MPRIVSLLVGRDARDAEERKATGAVAALAHHDPEKLAAITPRFSGNGEGAVSSYRWWKDGPPDE